MVATATSPSPSPLISLSVLSPGLLEVGGGPPLGALPPPAALPAAAPAPPLVAAGASYCQDRVLLHHLGLCEGGQTAALPPSAPPRPPACSADPSVSPQVCLFNLVFVLCVGVSLPCRGWRPLLSGFCTVWTCVVTVCKMLYQLNVVQPSRYSSNCTTVTMATAVAPPPRDGLRVTVGVCLCFRCSQ